MKSALAVLALVSSPTPTFAQTVDFVLSYFSSPGRLEGYDGSGTVIANSSGSPGGQFVGAALDAAGNWVTTKRSPERVERFNSAGVYLNGFNLPEVAGASDCAVFADGTIAVCALSGTGGTHLYSPTGAHVLSLPTGANTWGCNVDSSNRLWVVVLTGNPSPPSTVHCYTQAGVQLASFVLQFRASDIDFAPNGELWFSDTNSRLVRTSSSGVELSSFDTGLGTSVYGLAMNSDGSLWTVGFNSTQLRRYSPSGTLLANIPLAGAGAVMIAGGETCGNFGSYCSAGTSVNGCVASISASGNPSVSSASGFNVSVQNLEGQKQALFFYGLSGPIAQPWGTGGTSLLCVKQPTQRMGAANTGGLFGMCDGTLALDFNAWLASHPTALGQPMASGQPVHLQAWYRDPGSAKNTSLSDGLYFRLCP